MNNRWLRIAALVWACLWFGVIVPGHQRGAVTVPGTRIALNLPACCAPHGVPAEPVTPDAPGSSRGDPARDCFLCHVTARLDMPLAVVFAAPLLERLGESPAMPLRALVGLWFVPTTRGRDPPPAV